MAIAFADLAGYTRLTEEQGDEQAVSAVERFVEEVERTLPIDARVLKTLGDEVMVVATDPVALTRWAVGFQAQAPAGVPPPRIGIHYGEAIYRDGDYYGREVNQAARVVARAAGGEVLVTRAVVDLADGVDGLAFKLIGEVGLKGFSEPTELFLALSDAATQPRPTPRRSASGCGRGRPAAGGRAGVGRVGGDLAMLSGAATRSACSIWRCSLCGAPNVHALHVNYGLRPEADEEERHCRELCERLGVALEVVRARAPRRRRQPAGVGARAALRRPRLARARPRGARARGSSGGRRSRRSAHRHRPHRHRPGRDDPLPPRGLARPARAAGDGAPRGPPRAPAAGAHARADRRLLPRARPDAGGRTRATTTSSTRARACATGCVPALDAVHPAARENVLRTAQLLREEAEVLDGLVDAELGGAASIAIERLRALPAALARLIVVRLAERGRRHLCAAGRRPRGGDPRPRRPRRARRAARRRARRRRDRGRPSAHGRGCPRAS